MSIPYIRPIDLDAANDAYARTEATRNKLLRRAAIKRSLAENLHGALLNCRIEDAAAALFPSCSVRYSGTAERKVLYITANPSSPAYDHMSITIGTRGQRRVVGADLIESATNDEKESERLAGELSTFYDKLAQYNAIAGYMQSLSKDLQSVMIYTSMFY